MANEYSRKFERPSEFTKVRKALQEPDARERITLYDYGAKGQAYILYGIEDPNRLDQRDRTEEVSKRLIGRLRSSSVSIESVAGNLRSFLKKKVDDAIGAKE